MRRANHSKVVQYELMHGRDAAAAIRECPVAYLPIGCIERHGDHLPMGLDVLKAHGICCEIARSLGGVVFPPHFYAGIHRMSRDQLNTYTAGWGNVYTDATAEDHLLDIIEQISLAGIRVIVLHTGHYPQCQVDMVRRVAEKSSERHLAHVIPFAEMRTIGDEGDHAGISETSLMLYLDRSSVDMTRIGVQNYRDHGWTDANTPEKASAARGEADVQRIADYLETEISRVLASCSE